MEALRRQEREKKVDGLRKGDRPLASSRGVKEETRDGRRKRRHVRRKEEEIHTPSTR